MEYRRLGTSGLKLSVLSFGSWVTFGSQLDDDLAMESMTAARDAGVNFFDNAESYGGGDSERIMGRVLANLGWARSSYVVSTKVFWGLSEQVNMSNTLNRKYLLQAVDGCLDRFGLDFVDLLFCHRSDPETPVEETVWAMHDIVSAGKALYWGTSEWPGEALIEAYEICDRHHLRRPTMEQPQYNLFNRARVEQEYRPIIERHGLGLTTWSPLASGQLSGKYLDGIPEGSRGALEGYEWLRSSLTDRGRNGKLRELKSIAAELDCTMAQLAIAWCARNPLVSTVITGASRPSQVVENMESLGVLSRLDDEIIVRIEAASS
ncbi:MAG: aldo/keto reductase [Actinomycetota bacterium]|nr:aldo/keto reductase [Actinomycetota bacterium]